MAPRCVGHSPYSPLRAVPQPRPVDPMLEPLDGGMVVAAYVAVALPIAGVTALAAYLVGRFNWLVLAADWIDGRL